MAEVPATTGLSLPGGSGNRNRFPAAVTLPRLSFGSGYCWLPSPAALSSTGRGRLPGQSKLEARLRAWGVLQRREVLDPAFLSACYGLPEGFLDRSECRAAAELCGSSEWRRGICWT